MFQAVLTMCGMFSIPNHAGCVARETPRKHPANTRLERIRKRKAFYRFSVASTPKSYDSFARPGGRLLHNAIRVSTAGACSPGLDIARQPRRCGPHWPFIVLPFHRYVRQPRPSDRIVNAVSAIPSAGLLRGRSTSRGMGGLNACRRNSLVFSHAPFRKSCHAVFRCVYRARAAARSRSRLPSSISSGARRISPCTSRSARFRRCSSRDCVTSSPA